MKEVTIKNNPFGNYASNALEHLGLISVNKEGTMNGIKGLSNAPLYSDWQGMGWGELNIELSEGGLKVLKSANFDIDFEVKCS